MRFSSLRSNDSRTIVAAGSMAGRTFGRSLGKSKKKIAPGVVLCLTTTLGDRDHFTGRDEDPTPEWGS